MSGLGGMLSKAGVPTSGVRQVETATAAGTLSGASGDVSVIVTAAGLTGSPLTVLVPTTTGDTAAVWAGKVRTVLAADAAIAAFFDVSGTTTAIVLTAKKAAANDATMNIALANGTSTGVTAAPTSVDTTAGVKADWRGVDHGQRVVNSSTNDIYINTGSANSPTWTLL
jgi:hypothetical protein